MIGYVFTTTDYNGNDTSALVLTDPAQIENLRYLSGLVNDVLEPIGGYNITDANNFFWILLRENWNGQYYYMCWDILPDGSEFWVYAIFVNNNYYSVHPYLMKLIFVLNGLPL